MQADEHTGFLQTLFDQYGGRIEFFRAMEARQAAFMALWLHDASEIGRILHAHLVVEHYLNRYLQAHNPSLGSIEDARLSFAQKSALLPDAPPFIAEIKRGLKILGRIRNRMAHTLKLELTEADSKSLLCLDLFRAMLAESDSRFGPTERSPLDLVERYAQFAATMLQSASEKDAELWRAAFASLHAERDA